MLGSVRPLEGQVAGIRDASAVLLTALLGLFSGIAPRTIAIKGTL